jgi:hypothetical protein
LKYDRFEQGLKQRHNYNLPIKKLLWTFWTWKFHSVGYAAWVNTRFEFDFPNNYKNGVRMYRLQKSIIYKFVDRHKVRIVLIVEFPIFLYVESYYIYFPKNYHVVYKYQILCQMSLASNLICFDYYHLLSSSSILPRVRRI